MDRNSILLWFIIAATADAASNPLTYTPFWHETQQGFVTIVQKSGKLIQVLSPGLHFTPWSLLGESYTLMPTSPQTNCYPDVVATTSDLARYKIGICVVNQVNAHDVIEVVKEFGFDYSTETLGIQQEIAIKEVITEYDMLDIQVTKAGQFNEDLRGKIRKEMDVVYGDLGKKIQILGVTIRNKDIYMMDELKKEFEKQTNIQNEVRTEEQKMRMQEKKEKIETDRLQAELEVQFTLLKKRLENENSEVTGEMEAQMERTKQALTNAESQANVTSIQALSEYEQIRMKAELFEKHKGYAQHQRAMSYSSILANQTKFVIQDSINNATQNSMLNANVMSYVMKAEAKEL